MVAMNTARSAADQAYRQAMKAPIREIAHLLQQVLSRRLTSYIVDVKEGKTVSRWASGEVSEIRERNAERRLRTTYEIVLLLLQSDSPRTVRAWFIGLNPELGDISPADAIHEGRLKDALDAARVFVAGD